MTQEGNPEPGDIPDIRLGLTNQEAGNPSLDPPENDQELGDEEELEDLGEDFDEEDD
jgi:hypothetical protein